MLNTNIGTIDRTLRIIVGIALVGVGAWSLSWWGIVGFALLFTALVSWCPLYAPFGISTCQHRDDDRVSH